MFVFENEGIDCLFTGGFLLETQAEVTYTFDFCDIISTKVLSINLIFQQEYQNPGCNAFMGKLFVWFLRQRSFKTENVKNRFFSVSMANNCINSQFVFLGLYQHIFKISFEEFEQLKINSYDLYFLKFRLHGRCFIGRCFDVHYFKAECIQKLPSRNALDYCFVRSFGKYQVFEMYRDSNRKF